VGIIGAGAMGMAIAGNLADRGHRVLVRDIDPDVQARSRAAGLTVCASPRELAALAELVLVVVVDAAQIDQVLFASDGVARAGSGARTVLLASTIAPEDALRTAQQLSPYGLSTIDGPISGGPARARAGTMSMMLAAPEATLAPWQPLLADLAAKRFVVSATVGDAAKAKLVNNLLAGIHLAAAAEALALSEKIGLPAQTAFDIITASSGNSWIFEDRMPRALAGAFVPALAGAHILTKDLGLATAMAARVGHATPLGLAALARFRETVARGWGALDDSAVIKICRE
jgi:3-hydroxyisobutyrate dehydrogenase